MLHNRFYLWLCNRPRTASDLTSAIGLRALFVLSCLSIWEVSKVVTWGFRLAKYIRSVWTCISIINGCTQPVSLFFLFPWNKYRNHMILFNLRQLISFALVLFSLDAVTATSVPRDDGSSIFYGNATAYDVPEGGKLWVFCYLMSTAMLNSSSNPIIDSR